MSPLEVATLTTPKTFDGITPSTLYTFRELLIAVSFSIMISTHPSLYTRSCMHHLSQIEHLSTDRTMMAQGTYGIDPRTVPPLLH